MMTTCLVDGMSFEEAAAVVRDKVIAQLAVSEVGIWTEVDMGSALICLARRGAAACTIVVPRNDYSGAKLLELLSSLPQCQSTSSPLLLKRSSRTLAAGFN